jgi:hypothetical protein
MDRNSEHRFCDIEDEVNSILDENIENATRTQNKLVFQGQQIENVELKLTNIEYFTKKGKEIINRMSSFFHRFRTPPVNYTENIVDSTIQMNELDETSLFVSGETTLSKLNRLKKIGLQMGEELDEQNIKLDKMDLDVDKNNSYLKKNVEKINKIL